MAKIKFGKKGHLELEITPLTIWSNPGSEGEFMEYQLGLFCEGENVFNPALEPKLVALKDEENVYLSDFIAETLAERKENNWMMLEPKVSLYMRPVPPPAGCCSAYNQPDNFLLQMTLEQNIFAGEDKVFGPYSNTGLTISFEAAGKDWADFAQAIRAEEEDFDEEDSPQEDPYRS
ncbi:hypothetical protein [Candidatus Avelusimicrobium gallicola]|uniref:Uncharacterized protein n=1 Tax=Candidatus Avelusimicrobium gallicola TaxID=2562704 RepID=A0A1Y4DM08_9BACT|nr:hypothetical protein [Elusimicrobium sp. An273]OUO57330.1 hypothetical protein B5F75_00710 [Elusimicrobium sp. An273]